MTGYTNKSRIEAKWVRDALGRCSSVAQKTLDRQFTPVESDIVRCKKLTHSGTGALGATGSMAAVVGRATGMARELLASLWAHSWAREEVGFHHERWRREALRSSSRARAQSRAKCECPSRSERTHLAYA
jgi:hypothetical protein